MIEEGDFPEELPGGEGGEDGFLAGDGEADVDFAFEQEVHGIARAAFLDDFLPLFGFHGFHEIEEPLQLCVSEAGEDLDAAQGGRLYGKGRAGGEGERFSGRSIVGMGRTSGVR